MWGFQFLLILDLWGTSFHTVVVFGMDKNFLFESALGHGDLQDYPIWLACLYPANLNYVSHFTIRYPVGVRQPGLLARGLMLLLLLFWMLLLLRCCWNCCCCCCTCCCCCSCDSRKRGWCTWLWWWTLWCWRWWWERAVKRI